MYKYKKILYNMYISKKKNLILIRRFRILYMFNIFREIKERMYIITPNIIFLLTLKKDLKGIRPGFVND